MSIKNNNDKKNIEQQTTNKSWLKKLLGLNPTYSLRATIYELVENKLFLKDIVFLYSFIASILYGILFYLVSTPQLLSQIRYFNYTCVEFLENLVYVLDFIVLFVIWILYLLISRKNLFVLKKKIYQFSIGYGLFLFPLTIYAFYMRGINNIGFKYMLYCSLTLSLYRIVGSIIFLIIINLIIEIIILIIKKIFNYKQ